LRLFAAICRCDELHGAGLARSHADEKLVNLSPGMAVTVEIKTGSRRIISYLMSPLLRYKQEMLRER
jgi:hemolysin D